MAEKRKIDEVAGTSSGGGNGNSPAAAGAAADVAGFDVKKTEAFVTEEWLGSAIPTLEEYIKIPNQSPTFDPEWATNGLQEKVVELFVDWVKSKNVPGLALEVVKLEGMTPLIFMEVEATTDCPNDVGTVLMYGHLDKQPPFVGWNEGLDPYVPVTKDGKLYGRGGADDGYAIFAAVTAIRALQAQKCPHGRIVVIIEAAEESGSPHLPPYIEHLRDRIGSPNLVVCLDSGAGSTFFFLFLFFLFSTS